VIRSEAEKEKPMHPFLRDGLERGMEKGLEQGLQQGLQEGRTEGLALLVRVFERRLGRSVTARERRRLVERFEKDGPELLGDAAVDLSPEQISSWLAARKSSKRAR
ncbi:MAG TPA: hypothetical protein PKA58_25020, partial [Polyangium sp.]|nr:hypothetical protein [Polyangium sp.]